MEITHSPACSSDRGVPEIKGFIGAVSDRFRPYDRFGPFPAVLDRFWLVSSAAPVSSTAPKKNAFDRGGLVRPP